MSLSSRLIDSPLSLCISVKFSAHSTVGNNTNGIEQQAQHKPPYHKLDDILFGISRKSGTRHSSTADMCSATIKITT